MRQLILSCSLSPSSRSAIMARQLADDIQAIGDEAQLIDLRNLELPFCDADECYLHPEVVKLSQAIRTADAATIATPIYNFETGGVTRNMIALTGSAWTDKVVGFVCAAGGQGSYMAVMSLANSLMLDFRCLIVPRFVYATGAAFDGDRLADTELRERIGQLAAELHRIAGALARTEADAARN